MRHSDLYRVQHRNSYLANAAKMNSHLALYMSPEKELASKPEEPSTNQTTLCSTWTEYWEANNSMPHIGPGML